MKGKVVRSVSTAPGFFHLSSIILFWTNLITAQALRGKSSVHVVERDFNEL